MTKQALVRQLLDLGVQPAVVLLVHTVFRDAFPECRPVGIDLDRSLLPLAEARLGDCGKSVS